MSRLNWMGKACGVFPSGIATAIVLPAQTFTTLYSFDETVGATPTRSSGPVAVDENKRDEKKGRLEHVHTAGGWPA
jgi:hypothetical protein